MVENTLVPPAENVNVSKRLENFWVDLFFGGEGSFSEKFWRNWGGSPNVQQMLRALREIADGFETGATLLGTRSEGAQEIEEAGVYALYREKQSGDRACFAAGVFLAAIMGGNERAADRWRGRFSEDYAQAICEAHGRVMGEDFITAEQVAKMVRAVEEFAKEKGFLSNLYEPLIEELGEEQTLSSP